MASVEVCCAKCGAVSTFASLLDITVCRRCGAPLGQYLLTAEKTGGGDPFAGAVCREEDFVIRGGVLEKYKGKDSRVAVPDGVVSIGPAFENHQTVKAVVLPEGVASIGGLAFKNCVSLSHISLPLSLIKVGFHAFENCRSLRTLRLPAGLCEIGFGAFSGCTRLERIEIPSGVSFIAMDTFSSCRNLKEVVIPEGVTEIESPQWSGGVFAGCRSLTRIVLPDSLAVMGEHVFNGCVNLSDITLPFRLLKHRGNYMFHDVDLEIIRLEYLFNDWNHRRTVLRDTFLNRTITLRPAGSRVRKYELAGKCRHCGGDFKSTIVSGQVCRVCGRNRDY